jgi:hypothetical protein
MITKDSRNMWCDVLVFWDAMIFCNNFARWLQKIVETCDVMRCVGFLGCYDLCNNFARWLQKIVETCDVLVFWDAMIFCNNFARWLQKIVETCDVLVSDAMIFCNNFARWLQKIVAKCDAMCWLFWDTMIFCDNFAKINDRGCFAFFAWVICTCFLALI